MTIVKEIKKIFIDTKNEEIRIVFLDNNKMKVVTSDLENAIFNQEKTEVDFVDELAPRETIEVRVSKEDLENAEFISYE